MVLEITRTNKEDAKEYWAERYDARIVILAKNWKEADKKFKRFIKIIKEEGMEFE